MPTRAMRFQSTWNKLTRRRPMLCTVSPGTAGRRAISPHLNGPHPNKTLLAEPAMPSTCTSCGRHTARVMDFPPPNHRPPWRSLWRVVASTASPKTPPRLIMNSTSNNGRRTRLASRAT
eukprot:5013426-Pleurochrysis_carterae.AAC.1